MATDPFRVSADTPIGSLPPEYRKRIITALKVYAAQLKKTIKNVEKVDGDTAEYYESQEIVDDLNGCLGARTETALTDTPIGRAMDEGKRRATGEQLDLTERDDEIVEPGVELDDPSVIIMQLGLVHYDANPEDIAEAVEHWTRRARRAVYRWAVAMQLAGTPGAHAKVPRRPACVKKEWLSLDFQKQIEIGVMEPETNSTTGEMTPDEIAQWIATGPWAPMETDEPNPANAELKLWSLRFNAPEGHTGDIPVYVYRHPGELAAGRVAASINKILGEGRASSPLERDESIDPTNAADAADAAAKEEPPAEGKGKKKKRLVHRKAAPKDPKPPKKKGGK